jgi:rhamnose transport system substrate-binding protein
MTRPTILGALGVSLLTLGAAGACRSGPGEAGAGGPAEGAITVAMMPKNKGNPYFVSCRQGAEEAAQALGVRLLWDGPTETDPAKQNEVVETWITRGVQAIAVSVENREAMSTVLRKARGKGIKVVTWDADADPDARDAFVNQATPRGIAETLLGHANRLAGGAGEIAIVTGSLTAANQNSWIAEMRKVIPEKYPQLTIVDIRPSDDDRRKAFDETQTLLRVHPKVKVIMAIASPAVPGAAEAVKQSGRKDVGVTGLGLPNAAKPYLQDGVLDSAVLWNTRDLGYLTVHVAAALARGTPVTAAPQFEAGRLGRLEVRGDNVILGTPFTFTGDNVGGFDF